MKNVFIFLFFILFPFGQTIRIGIMQPIDVVVGMAAIYTVFAKLKKPDIFKHFNSFLIIASFSWIVNIFIFNQVEVVYGLLYLFRLIAYFYFSIYVWNFVKDRGSEFLIKSILAVTLVSGIIGWIQLIFLPDTRFLFSFGWDDHLFRMIGTFLDPTFLGLIFVFGLIVSVYQYLETKNKYYLVAFVFLFISLAFTYSRASYLAFFAGISVIAYHKKLFGKLLILIPIFACLVLVLPTSKNHILSFTRQFSAVARVENYKTALTIFKKSPLFGIGYNNMCIGYQKYIGVQSFSSHACSGSDSSLLLLLSTTGVLGLMSFVFLIKKTRDSVSSSNSYVLLAATFCALMVHSLFSNSLVYSWVMGLMVIILAITF